MNDLVMPKPVVVVRPTWRSFRPEFLARAIEHVDRGGFGAIVHRDGTIRLLLPRASPSGLTTLARWALLCLEIPRTRTVRAGPARGLATVRVPPRDRDSIREWCERDSAHPRATRRLALDCGACGACCRDNHVVIGRADVERWCVHGRADWSGRAYLRTSKGTRLLRLTNQGRCIHLKRDGRCRIYALRPDNCRAFPVGSEACLAARIDTLGIVD
jgi:uncharacterized protein